MAQAGRQNLDIPAGTLGAAIAILGVRTGASIGTSSPDLLRVPVRAVRGRGSVDETLRSLLAGTAIEAKRTGPLAWRLSRRAIVRKPPAARPRPAPPTSAAPASDPLTADVVVTAARRRTQNAGYPADIHTFGVDDLSRLGSDVSVTALARLDPAIATTSLGPGRNKIFLRGIADSSFNGPTSALVGEYLGETRLTYAGPDPDLHLYDVARVDVLAGPQGTLYGAGTLAGIIRITPNAPVLDAMTGRAWVAGAATEGGAPSGDAGAIVNVPLAHGTAALRATGYVLSQGGYIDDTGLGRNDVNRTRVAGGRAAFRIAPGAGWTMEISGIAQTIRNDDAQYSDRDTDLLTRASSVVQPSGSDLVGGALVVEHDNGATRLTANLSLVGQRQTQVFDATGIEQVPTRYMQENTSRLLDAELRLAGGSPAGIDWVIGTSFLRNITRETRRYGAVGDEQEAGEAESLVRELTGFGEATVVLAPRLRFTAGARLAHVATHGTGGGFLARAEGLVSTRMDRTAARHRLRILHSAALAFEPADRVQLYLRHATGWRPGVITVNGPPQLLRSDSISTTEVGARYAAPGLTVNASAQYSDWEDVQADTLDGLGIPHVSNIGDGTVKSVSVTAVWRPIRRFALTAGGFLAASRVVYDGVSVIGVGSSDLPNVARDGAVLTADYAWDHGPLSRATMTVRRVGKSLLGAGPSLAFPQGDYVEASARVERQLGDATIALDLTNLLDTRGNRFALGTPFTVALGDQITPLRPRTVRLSIERRF